jgi:NAD(P)-dependent dehydrogenase (short-subunit alcohol dehydrogenase family)
MTTSTTPVPARKDRTWFITGASSGFGRLLAEEVLKAGDKAIVTARNIKKVIDLEQKYPGKAKAFTLDVTDYPQIVSVVAQSTASYGPIDVLVNNAGYGLIGAVEEVTEDEFMPMFNTNVFGLIRVTQTLLPHLRKQGSGHILNISSISGLIGTAGWGYYNCSKFAVEGLTEALAQELAPLGIRVTAIEPGPFRTDFIGRSGVEAATRIPEYEAAAGKAREYLHNQSGKQPGDPMRAVHAMMAVVDTPNPPLHLILGTMALKRFRDKQDQWKKEIAEWESTTTTADFPEGK